MYVSKAEGIAGFLRRLVFSKKVWLGRYFFLFSFVLAACAPAELGAVAPAQKWQKASPGAKALSFYHKDRTVSRGASCVTAQCHPTVGKAKYVHTPVSTGSCEVCHDARSSDVSSGVTRSGKELCLNCHEKQKAFYNDELIHPPLEDGCVDCHNPHESPYKFQIQKGPSMGVLCFDCHDKDEKVGFKYLHGPMTAEDCTSCHDPHSSDFGMLVHEGPDELHLCASCHEQTGAKILNGKYKHGPIKEGKCSPCHAFHGSNLIKNWTKQFAEKFYNQYDPQLFALCFSCHKKAEAFNSEFTTLTDFRNGKRNLHYLHVTRKKGRACIACHDVHATEQAKQISNAVPFGSWNIPIEFIKTPTGGKCSKSCHVTYAYDRVNPVKLIVDKEIPRKRRWKAK
ncbi:MAG: cytochrome C [Deltaproteobacteria bacterium]|nr:cytochrome C [Deltaproteobacteria bacterium]